MVRGGVALKLSVYRSGFSVPVLAGTAMPGLVLLIVIAIERALPMFALDPRRVADHEHE